MFKVSQEIRLNTSAAGALGQGQVQGLGDASDGNSPESVCIFGRYQRTPDAGECCLCGSKHLMRLFINTRQMRIPQNRRGRLESPSGQHGAPLQLTQLDPERFQVQCQLPQAGLYKVHIKCNSVPLPKSPYIIVTIAGVPPTEDGTDPATCSPSMPVFESDASKVHSRGLGLTHVNLLERNEFTVDGSAAGSNMLFVGILGAQGPCDEVLVKHLGRHVYRVIYQVREPGEYILVAKWGEQHIPGSPFSLTAD
nr:filamin-B isoform X2 [Drosophila virilis]